MLVHVVSFSPASDDLASTGGFEWALVHLEIPAEHAVSSDAITDYIDSHLELIEPRGTPVARST